MHEPRISAIGSKLVSWNQRNAGSVTRRHSLFVESLVALDRYLEMYILKGCSR